MYKIEDLRHMMTRDNEDNVFHYIENIHWQWNEDFQSLSYKGLFENILKHFKENEHGFTQDFIIKMKCEYTIFSLIYCKMYAVYPIVWTANCLY